MDRTFVRVAGLTVALMLWGCSSSTDGGVDAGNPFDGGAQGGADAGLDAGGVSLGGADNDFDGTATTADCDDADPMSFPGTQQACADGCANGGWRSCLADAG